MSLAARSTTLAELRLITAPRARNVLPFSRFAGGLPRGALTEISGPHGGGKTRFVLDFLAETPNARVAWIEDELSVYPRAFTQAGVSLSRVLFAETGEHAHWTAHQILRSGLFNVVVLSLEENNRDERDQIGLRRLQLAAERAGAALVLLSETAASAGSWPIAVQLDVNRNSVRRLK